VAAAGDKAAGDKAAGSVINRQTLFEHTDESPLGNDQATQVNRFLVALSGFAAKVYDFTLRKEHACLNS
jgi:hypothetical protein